MQLALFKNVICLNCPLMTLPTIPNNTLMLVDFIPPPVPLGDAPITIAAINTASDVVESFPIFTVLKPAVVDADIT